MLRQAIARVGADEDEDTGFATDEDDLEDEETTEPEGLTEAEPPVGGTDQKPTTAAWRRSLPVIRAQASAGTYPLMASRSSRSSCRKRSLSQSSR